MELGAGKGFGEGVAWEPGLCTKERSALSSCIFIFFYSAPPQTFKKTVILILLHSQYETVNF